jgi:cobalt transporter subunit CbtA
MTGGTRSPSPAIEAVAVFRAIVFAAVAAGLAAGIAVSALQTVTTSPLILAAERYEQRAATSPAHAQEPARSLPALDAAAPKAGAAPAAGEPWAPADGIERIGYTTFANVLAGTGFALILTACFALAGGAVDGRRGMLWGAAGFAVFTLAPALGLPPELPGTAAADLAGRQLWWLTAAAGTAVGLWLLGFRRGATAKVLGLVALALPHLAGPPPAHQLTHAVPAELAAHFAAASIVTAAVFWILLGWLAGTFYARLRPMSAAAPSAQAATS